MTAQNKLTLLIVYQLASLTLAVAVESQGGYSGPCNAGLDVIMCFPIFVADIVLAAISLIKFFRRKGIKYFLAINLSALAALFIIFSIWR